nr:hypothetical protein F383_34996 [Ipomoea batatas]GMD92647.1 hypothetical protein F383_34996 [Ipomoea batatas]GME00988.1 hypothetical protein F383_34996 [Ipomoea batatas]
MPLHFTRSMVLLLLGVVTVMLMFGMETTKRGYISIPNTLQALQPCHSAEMADCWLWPQVIHLRREINYMNQMPYLSEV